MRVPLYIVEERRRKIADYLRGHAYTPVKEVCERFEVSEATARRDLAALAVNKEIVRTYGGALADYGRRFPTFREREERHTTAKARIATAARELILPDTTCFLDFGTTVYALARELRRRPVAYLRIVTNSIPVADLLTAVPNTRVYLLGGELLARQSALLGGTARKALRFYDIDQAFLGAQAANLTGVWNSQHELVNFQKKVLEEAAQNVLCIDASKLGQTAPAFLCPWDGFDLVITDARARQVAGLPMGQTQFV